MQNPWILIPLDTYENHMMRADIFQAQTLAARMRARFADRDIGSVTILGIAGGNGLELHLHAPGGAVDLQDLLAQDLGGGRHEFVHPRLQVFIVERHHRLCMGSLVRP